MALKRVIVDESLIKQMRRLKKSPFYKHKTITEISKDVIVIPKYTSEYEKIFKIIKKSVQVR